MLILPDGEGCSFRNGPMKDGLSLIDSLVLDQRFRIAAGTRNVWPSFRLGTSR